MISFLARRLAPFLLFFIVLEAAVRVALLVYSKSDIAGAGTMVPAAFIVGLGFDLAAFFYVVIPVMLFALFLPAKWQGTKADRAGSAIVFFLFAFILLFCATGEWFFWDEFQARYNFIAVDYLVYTQEVIGNIRESYPVGWLVAGMAVIAAGLSGIYYKRVVLPTGVFFGRRLAAFGVLAGLCVVSFVGMQGRFAEITQNRYLNEVARNGIYELFSAFRNNELEYGKFYISRPLDQVAAFVRAKVGGTEGSESPLDRVEKNPKKKNYNLVVVTVESLSANYLQEFGHKRDITPHLDALIDKSLFFSNLYAMGTRTVYGLSALTLAMPPVPGNSIVRKPDNGNMASIGQVLRAQGYTTKFVYGGFGYFDNMNAFFGANGYEIIDRSSMKKEEISFANIWGVADEDLFRKVISENDKAHAEGKPFFDMVMTTSNHRPYTFPDGRIDLPSKSGGREAGVKYTDYAINNFLEEAAKKPWFKDTIFVIVADHTAGSSGKSELEPKRYHIPMWIYAPDIIKPGRVDWMASQIDAVPTVLGLMGKTYDSRFYGVDLMKVKPERAFISNYQKLGYINKDGLVILSPVNEAAFFTKDAAGEYQEQKDVQPGILDEAIGYYQGASQWRTWSRAPAP